MGASSSSSSSPPKILFGSLPLFSFPMAQISVAKFRCYTFVCALFLFFFHIHQSPVVCSSHLFKKKVFTIVWLFGRRSMLMKHIAIFSSENLKPANPITCIGIATPIRSKFMTAYKMCAFAIACGYVRRGCSHRIILLRFLFGKPNAEDKGHTGAGQTCSPTRLQAGMYKTIPPSVQLSTKAQHPRTWPRRHTVYSFFCSNDQRPNHQLTNSQCRPQATHISRCWKPQ